MKQRKKTNQLSKKIKIISLKANPDHTIDVRLSDGREGRVNLRHMINGQVYEPLQEPDYFCLAEIDGFGAICWPNGADIAIEKIIDLLIPKESAMHGNKNAQIDDEPRNETIIIRVTPSFKQELTKKAMNDGRNLSSWILNKLM